MVTKDHSAGLLSKVARFVRHPTKDWSELDLPEPEPEPEDTYGKKALQEVIERKRRNDLVRRREFDQLRKLRRTGLLLGTDRAAPPSVFQGSTTASNLDERATTIKKIDQIEAQMSRQWWKGKQAEATVPSDSAASVADQLRTSADATTTASAAKVPGDTIISATTVEPGPRAQTEPGSEYEPTQMGLVTDEEGAAIGTEGQQSGSGLSEFSASKLLPVEAGGVQADVDLEEAAIRFANGDDQGAEATLLAALQAEEIDLKSAVQWAAALFDYYRATGQQAGFDRLAVDYAQRFGRQAPAWFSIPDLLKQPLLAPGPQSPTALASGVTAAWNCPVALDLSAVQALQTDVARATAARRRFNWSRLKTISADGAAALAQLFAQWCMEPVRLRFDGASVLEKTLKYYTPSGQKQLALFWWQLRFDALRIMRLHNEFELAALDYCVTYEVSPPPWVDARCDCVTDLITTDTPVADFEDPFEDTAPVDHGDPSPAPALSAGPGRLLAVEIELVGELLGDASQALNKFKTGLWAAGHIVVSCARLVRVDFSAAGSILTWVVARESEGCVVQFHTVPHLVAAFFNVIGINEHARVVPRTD
jgi:ABC-type transporter Mla MlaB component